MIMKFIEVIDATGKSRRLRTKLIETIEGGSNNQAKFTMSNRSTYIVKRTPVSFIDMCDDVVFLQINFDPAPARMTLVNIDMIQVIETLESPLIKTNYSTALCMCSGQVILCDRSVPDVAEVIIQLSRKD